MNNGPLLKLEGSVKGPWVNELQKAWAATSDATPKKPVTVDLAGVTFMDAKGRDLLLEMQQGGAVLQGGSPFLRHVLDENGQKTTHEGPRD